MLKAVYSAFAADDADLLRRAGEAVSGQLRGLRRSSFLKLCEQFRDFTSLEWTIDWAEVRNGKLSQSLREEVFLALEKNGRELPDGMEKAILYDMKYV